MWTAAGHSARGRYYRRTTARYWKENWIILSLALLELLGVWIGARLAVTAEGGGIQEIGHVLTEFLSQRTSQSIQTTLLMASGESFLWLLFLFCCGFSLLCIPFILLVPLVKGMGFGLMVAQLLLQYGSQGLPTLLLILIPSTLLCSLLLLIGCRSALVQSLTLLQIVLGKEGGEERGGAIFSRFCIQFGLLIVLSLVEAAFEGILYTAFRSLILTLIG